ncbi:MAG: FHA domain-containing protein [Gemmataceae bacterium]|nr:FHA domain-containing protein [Gemmataceae bacterium]
MPNPDPATLTDQFARACRAAGPIELRAVHRPTGAEQAFAVAPPFAFVGRAPVMSVRLDDPSVSQCHALLQVVDGRPHLTDLGSRTGVLWDDGAAGAGWARPGRPVRLGSFDLDVRTHAPAADPEPADPPLPVAAEVFGPGGDSQDQPLDRPVTLVGRHPACHIRLIDEAAAYFHTALVNTPDGVWAVDLLTRRGTLVNGRPARLAPVKDGDLLEYGRGSVVLREGLPVARPLVLNGSAAVARPAEDGLTLQQRVAESVLVAFAPVRDMMDQFQQCFVAMAQMVTRMQQEQSGVMCEQMKLLQELTKELQEMRAEAKVGGGPKGPLAEPAPPPTPKLPNPKLAGAADGKTLKDAHQWFLDRLAQMGGPAPRRD